MAKDMTDLATVDFISPALDVVCGQVLIDRQRHIAIVVKKGRKCAHLVRVRSGSLRLVKCSAKGIVSDWMDAQYPFNEAMAKLCWMWERGRGSLMAPGLRLKSCCNQVQARLF